MRTIGLAPPGLDLASVVIALFCFLGVFFVMMLSVVMMVLSLRVVEFGGGRADERRQEK